MSKERLEEAKQDVKMTRKDLAVSPSNEMTLNMGILLNTMDWLIEQAERFEVLSEQHDEALMQNKRYREALERIAYDDELLSNTDDIIVAKEALEE